MPAPTRWIHLSERPGDQWVLPVWTAVHAAVGRGAVLPAPPGMSRLGVHITTRLNVLPLAWGNAVSRSSALKRFVAKRAGSENIYRQGDDAYALVMSMKPTYQFILAFDSALFETHACAELMRSFLQQARRHAKKPKVDSLKEEFKNAIAQNGADASWCDRLETARGFFTHEGTPYVAVDVSQRKRDLLLMKENIREFGDQTKFLRFSDVLQIAVGFMQSKPAIQRYLQAPYR